MIPENWAEKLPPDEGKNFDTRSIHFRQFRATLDFVPKKHPHMREIFLTPDLSISGNFEQLWILLQKRPPPPKDEGNFFDTRSIHLRQFWATLGFMAEKPPPPGWGKFFLTPDLSIWGNFEQLWILWQKSLPQDEGNFLTPDLSIWGNFEQLWILWQKSPSPQGWEKFFFDTRSIHFRQFWATLVFVAEKPPPPRWEKYFWHQIYPFEAIASNFGFCGRKAPQWGKIFWHQIYPSEAILSKLGFCGRKAPPPSFLPFHHGPDSHHTDHTGRIPKVPILQIHTQIPPIWISFIGYQLCQLFKILTYTELQDSGSWCIWKAYRQPYHNAH